MQTFNMWRLLFNLMLLVSMAQASRNLYDDILRRDSGSTTLSPTDGTTTVSNTQTTNTASTGTNTATGQDTASGSSGSSTTSGTQTGTDTAATQTGSGTSTATNSASQATTSATTSISVNPEWPAGGASMTYPPATSTTYYSIGQNVTLGWNYTSVQITPSAVDVVASCSTNRATYTLASNVSYANATSVVWDTDKYGSNSQNPLLTAHYTLIIYESGTSPTDVPSPGQLGPASYTFGMYLMPSYTPLSGYVCVTCNSAVSTMDRQTLGLVLGVAAVTVLSFTSFAGGFGL